MTLRELRLPLLACAAVVAVVVSAHAKVTETIKNTYPLTADGVIQLDNVNGSIKIVAWDKAEVSLEAEKSGKTEDDFKRISLEIDSQPAKLTIKTKYDKSGWSEFPRGGVDYVLMVPATVNLDKIASVNSNITVTGVKGTLTIKTVNGRIKAENAVSVGNFDTVNGTIRVQYDALPATGKIEMDSVNGSITIVVPKTSQFDLRADNVNGGIDCALPITVTKSGRHYLKGRVGQGGPAVDIDSVNGSLSVEIL